MTIQEALEAQAQKLLQNRSERAKDCLHELKRLATWLYIAQVKRGQNQEPGGSYAAVQ